MSGTGVSAPELAYNWVKNFIVSLPREQEAFLNEGAIADAAGTSRTPVREALLRLEAEGFIRRVPHKGAYVPPISDPEVYSLIQARSVVEKWAVEAGRATIEYELGELQDLITRQRDAGDNAQLFIELDIEFHGRMVRAAGNAILSDFYASLRQRQLRIGVKALLSGTDRRRDVLQEHQDIVDAIRTGDSQRAGQAIDAHLRSTAAVVIERTPVI